MKIVGNIVFVCQFCEMQVGLLNVDGFYNSLLSFIDKAVDEGFISPKARRIIVSAPTAKQLMLELEVRKYCPPLYKYKMINVML